MKALPTLYRGVTFRSRLEADWAATLDSLDIAWDYEPEGYKLSDGTYYSPDFYLPASGAWLEVKGAHMERVSKVEQFAAECESFTFLGLTPKRTASGERMDVRVLGRDLGVFITECDTCGQRRLTGYFSADNDPAGLWHPCDCDGGEHMAWTSPDDTPVRFVRVPRPAGRGR